MIQPTLASRYRIVDRLGAGGMGEVYRAHDMVLDRDVALKVLPSEVASDPERLARFEREAQATATLNHPNILAIHDFGTDGETAFAVTELLDGQTLRERLAQGRCTVKQSVEMALAIARGLAAAHAKGIVHRDLKPANLFVTREGVVKILDFGVAKLIHPAPVTEAPTQASLTATSAVVGTLGYMAPEQLCGEAVDPRADVFAFGCVLYEMLSGQPPFTRDTAAETMRAILNADAPPLDTNAAAVPPALARIVECCLAKRPDDRFSGLHDLALALQAVSGAPVRPDTSPVPRLTWRTGVLPWGVAALAILVALIVSRLPHWRDEQPATGPRRVTFSLSPAILGRAQVSPSLSPDGSKLVYLSRSASIDQLYLRPLARADASPIPGTENATSGFFSPDGQWLGFFADGKLKKIALAGGTAVTICAAGRGSHASWGMDDTVVFAPPSDGQLWRVAAAGGTPEALTRLDEAKGERSHGWPEILPGGEAVLFAVTTDSGGHIEALTLRTGGRKPLIESGSGPLFYTRGQIVYVGAKGILAVPFDPRKLTVTGPPLLVAEQASIFAASRDGLLVYGGSGLGPAAELALVWVDREGHPTPLSEARRSYFTPRLSPDGKRLAVGIRTSATSSDIWVLDLERDVLSRLTFDGSSAFPLWTPDGRRVVFSSGQAGVASLFWKAADGSGPEERLTASTTPQYPHSFSPDGRLLAFDNSLPGDIWLLPLETPRRAVALLATPFREWGPRFSPDGRWLAYLSDESGRLQLFVRRYPDSGGSWQLSTGGATEPMWAGNGREIFYRSDDRLMAVTVRTEPTFTASKPKTLFEARYEPGLPGISNYDLTPDGQRLVMVQGRHQEPESTQLTVVMIAPPR